MQDRTGTAAYATKEWMICVRGPNPNPRRVGDLERFPAQRLAPRLWDCDSR